MVDRAGFEPATSRVQVGRSYQLNYRPTNLFLGKNLRLATIYFFRLGFVMKGNLERFLGLLRIFCLCLACVFLLPLLVLAEGLFQPFFEEFFFAFSLE